MYTPASSRSNSSSTSGYSGEGGGGNMDEETLIQHLSATFSRYVGCEKPLKI